MAEPMLSVTWKDHANKLAATCNSFLENEFFVDCTISAEGKCLNAHRVILSASSPYFQMLFSEDSEKHPIVVLTDTLYCTLKTVMDFVYYGKAEIPASQIEAFLELAESLQIKGLDNSLQKDRKTNIGDSVERSTRQCLSSVNQGICEVGSIWTSQEDFVQTDSSVVVEGHSNCSKMLRSETVMMGQHDSERQLVCNDHNVSVNTEINVKHEPLHSECEASKNKVLGHQSPVHEDPEVLITTEISVKHEPLYSETEFLETRDKILGVVKQEDHLFENFGREKKDGLPPPHDRDLDQHSCGRDVTALKVPEKCDSFPPEHSVSQNVKTDDVENKECLGAEDVADDGTDEMNEGPESLMEEKLGSFSIAENIQPDEEQATQQRIGRSQGLEVSNTFPASGKALTKSEIQDKQKRKQLYLCDVCGKTFTQLGALGTHKRSHMRKRTCECDTCGKTFAHRRNLTRHIRTHTGERRYQCDMCGKGFIHPTHLANHKRTHTGERRYACDICEKAFISSSALTRHVRTHTGGHPYPCDMCEKGFSHPSDLSRHMRTHSGERPYSCDVCEMAFVDSSTLEVHKRLHTGERPYACEVCGKTFTHSGSVTNHMRIHTGERPYQCDVCGKTFTKACALECHKRLHSGERPCVCNVCGKAFAYSSELARHIRTHTGDRPFQCDTCGKAFPESDSLTRHMRIHTGERPYSCNMCERVFTQWSALNSHKHTHTGGHPYPCDICGKGFSVPSDLARHMRTHAGEHQYPRDVSGKAFVKSSNVLLHKRTHSSERTFTCDVCSGIFYKKRDLITHIRSIHPPSQLT